MIPVIEIIARKIVTRLEAIQVANGYNVNVSKVIRPKKVDENTNEDYQIRIIQADSERMPEMDCAGNPPAVAYNQPFEIEGIMLPSDTTTKSADEFRNEFSADITKALTTPATWWNWDGLAFNSGVMPPELKADDGGGVIGVKIVLNVMYRTSENDPYTARG
jgi:hypothetical protein